MTQAVEKIELLARSAHRVRILELLCEHRKMANHELRDHFSASRTTIGRNLTVLEEQGWIRRTNGECEITRHGELVAEKFEEVVETVEVTNRLEPVMKWVPDGSLDLDLRLLTDAEILLPESTNPYAMINRHVKLHRNAEQSRVLLPMIGLHAYEAAHESVTQDGSRTEGVVVPTIAETLLSDPNYATLTEEMAETGRFDLYVYGGDVPYGLALFDEIVQIAVHEDGEPRAILETDVEAVRDWAIETYQHYKRQSSETLKR